jgi:integrase
MDAAERRLLLHLLAKAGAVSPVAHAPYRIYARKTRKTDRRGRPQHVFYFAKWDPESQHWETAKSTGQTTRAAAETWAALVLTEENHSRETVGAFAKGMFDDGSEYLVHREQRGRALSWNHRRHCATYLKRYILPYFGTTRLADISALNIDRFQSWLLKQPARNSTATLSPSTANHVVQAFRTVTKWAIRHRLIAHDPFVGVESLATQPRRRGIFEPDEVRRIFALGAEGWPDPLARVLNMVAAACGLRKGELQGLRRSCVQETMLADGRAAAVLLVDASWERSGRLKGTKSGRSRLVPVPPIVYCELQGAMSASPWSDPKHYIFYSIDAERPMSHKKIDKDFARALAVAGIDEPLRLERALSFHSWRHWANSMLVNRGLPPLRAQQVIGHTSLKMTANYLHTGEDFSDVMAITDDIF